MKAKPLRRITLFMTPREFQKVHAALNKLSVCDLDLARVYGRANLQMERLMASGKLKPVKKEE